MFARLHLFRGGTEADRALWAKKGGVGWLARRRISNGREKGDYLATWMLSAKLTKGVYLYI